MRRVILASLAVTASLAVPAASATAAKSGWSKPFTLVPAGKISYQPSVAIAANGTAVVIWTQYDATKKTYALMAATRTPRGAIKKVNLGKAADAFEKPTVAVGRDGTFAVAWEYPGKARNDSLAVRVMPAGKKAFGGLAKVSPGNLSTDYGAGDAPSVGIDDTGTVYVAWVGDYSGRYQVVASQRAKGARKWSAPVRLSSSKTDAHGARIAASGNGKVALSWSYANSSVWAVTKSAATAKFGAPQQIASATFASSPPTVGTSGSGKSAVLWEQGSTSATHRIASKVGTGSFPANPQFVSAPGFAKYEALALSSNGSGTAAWQREVAGGWEIDAASLSARGTSWGKSAKINPTGFAATFGSAPAVAVNDRRAVVGWSEKDLQHASFVGVIVRTGSRWSKAASFSGLSAPSVAVAHDPVKASPVAGAIVWLSTSGLQISILKP